ncbi:MAG TPA: hypothetical protein VFS11_02345 [Gemmatimonadales bacterium]|nr:hypothetical protein [Gemmatimonadales bacterium]
MWRSLLAASALGLVANARASAAQDQPDVGVPPADSALATLRDQVHGRSKIRVRVRSSDRDLVLLGPRLDDADIRFERYEPGSWTFDSAGGAHALPLVEVSRVQVRSSAWAKGAIIGFLAGAVAIEAINAAGKYQIDSGETLFVGWFFGTMGAFAGAAIAAPIHKWHTVYESP